MPKTKRASKYHRIFKYRVKNVPKIKAYIVNKFLNEMANILKVWLYCLDISERFTMPILENQNVQSNLKQFYIAFGKQVVNRAKDFDLETLFNEIQIKKDVWIKRGLDNNILELLQEPNVKVGFIVCYILDQVKLIEKYGWFDYSYFDLSHFF